MIETRTNRVVQEQAISGPPPLTTTKQAIHAEVTQFFHQLNLSDTMKGWEEEDATAQGAAELFYSSTESSSIVRWVVLTPELHPFVFDFTACPVRCRWVTG